MKPTGSALSKVLLWLAAAAAVAALVILPRIFKSTPAWSTTIATQDALETVLASGRVVGEKSVPLSFVRPGRIAAEFIRDGSRIAAHSVLMRQDTRPLEQALAQAQTALAEARLKKDKLLSVDLADAEEKVRQAKANNAYAADFFSRQTELFAQKSVSLLQYEQSRRDRDLAASALAAAENQLRSLKEVQTVQADLAISKTENDLKKAELDLDDTILTAPAAGMVVSHDAHAGEFVQAGQRVALFIPEAPRTSIEIQVDETNAGRIAPGQPASVTSPAYPGRVFTGKVERLGAIVDAQRGSFPIVIALDRFEPDLLPESSVSAQITTGRATGVLLLEQRFILREGEKASVYIEENGRAKKVPVSVRDLGSGLFECREGLKSGQSVLLPQGLKDGLKIKLKPLPE